MITITFSGMFQSGELIHLNSHRKYGSATQLRSTQTQPSTKTISMPLEITELFEKHK